ncbi:chemotaxis protein CheW [bacterium]|nr:chemotaxis protein CheW [bacterium]
MGEFSKDIIAREPAKDKPAETGQILEKFLVFRIGDYNFAIRLMRLKELIFIKRLIRIPQKWPILMGLYNFRGQIIPIMNLAVKFGIKHSREKLHDKRLLIVNINEQQLGLLVDRGHQIMKMGSEKISPLPVFISHHIKYNYIKGFCIREPYQPLILIIDLEHLWSSEELDYIGQTVKEYQELKGK